MPLTPFIDELDLNYFPIDIMHISRIWLDQPDIRDDLRIKHSLMDLNFYHAGLQVKLFSVTVITNSDTSTIRYTFSFSNNDIDNLYVLDSDLMGSERFHYYTNGVIFRDDKNQKSLESEYKRVVAPEPYNSWDAAWFTKIPRSQSISRSIILKGYPSISKGDYKCYFYFSNPININKTERWLHDGRYWIGTTKSNEIYLKIN